MTTSLVVTAIGPDRPGIVSRLSDTAQQHGANWAGSRMANLAGQFAGMVHFEVPDDRADELEQALRSLDSPDLHVVIARSGAQPPATPRRRLRLEAIGHDRPGIVRELSGSLSERGVSIEDLHTQVTSSAMSGEPLFRVKALLVVPADLPDAELRRGLEALANELMVDLEPGETLA